MPQKEKTKGKAWERRFKKIMIIVAFSLSICTFLLVSYALFSNIKDGSFAVERAADRWADSQGQEEYCRSTVIDENTAVAFINYDCRPINRITKGIKDCKGQYYIFLDKIDGRWTIDESSRQVIW